MDIRAYSAADREGCLAVFASTGLEGREAFEEFLDSGTMFVAEHDGAVVGCGGFVLKGATAELRWGMVDKKWQRQGLGRFLLFYRLREIGKLSNVELVELEAPREVVAFFAGQGFREVSGDERRVRMVKRLAVCT